MTDSNTIGGGHLSFAPRAADRCNRHRRIEIMRNRNRQLQAAVRATAEPLERRLLFVSALPMFQLDGNALDSNAANLPPDDWNSLFPIDNSPNELGKIFIDPKTDGGAAFTGGGSKDRYDLTQWQYASGSTPDKDGILDAFGAAYRNSVTIGNNKVGDTILYFGLDRYDTSGSAQVGFWFFRDNIALGTGANAGKFINTVTGQPAHHHAPTSANDFGDVLVQANFSTGGQVTNFSVFEWVGTGGDKGGGTLRTLNAPADTHYEIVNTSSQSSPWPYTPKSGAANTFPISGFFEGGINLNYLLYSVLPPNTPPPCFDTFMAESRSAAGSDSVSQQLKDFALGRLDTCAGISGEKFNDLNGNGVKDMNEPGLQGWTINLDTNADGTINQTTTTDVWGFYKFEDLTAGTYKLTETPKSGWIQTAPAAPGSITLTVTQGQQAINNDFGNFQLISISGMKFRDSNANGIKDTGEVGLQGWTIDLDKGLNGTVDQTAVTDSSGNYSFTNLGPGMYRLREENQSGWQQTTTNPADITAVSGNNATNVNFGNAPIISISGQKFEDHDGNGVKNTGDQGLSGWTIQLDKNADGSVDATTSTDTNGNYSFPGLLPGTYRVREANQTGWTQTTANPADVTLSTSSVAGVDFGNFRNFSINGMKFKDNNGDGIKNGGDAGLQGWTINLDKGADGSIELTTTTASDGTYSFPNLGPGTYKISESQQTGWQQTFPASPGTYSVTGSSATNVTGKDFGNFQKITISGRKFNDLDGDGTDDGGTDPGLSGWTIQLDKGGDGSVDATTTTGTGGAYSFTDLGPGVYRIREINQTGWQQTTTDPADITASSGTNASGVNFGNFQKITISGRKFNDLDGDGTDDDGTDPGLSGWTIQLDRDANGTVDATTTTGAGGAYSFTDLGPGTYRIREANQTGWMQTTINPTDVTASSGTNATGNDFGNFHKINISGVKFNDQDGDGVRDDGEPGIAGWIIDLDKDADGAVDQTATTGSDGSYSFTNLGPATYRVREEGQSSWIQTTADPADITAVSGTNVNGVDFGNLHQVPAVSIVKLTNSTDNDTGAGPHVTVGSTVTWTYTVSNTGNVGLKNIVVTDDNGTPANTADDFTAGTISLLAAGNTATFTHTGTAIVGQYGNVGTVNADANNNTAQHVSATNPDHYFGDNPIIQIVKLTNGTNNNTAPGPHILAGTVVTWTYNVTDPGNTPLSSVVVTDDNGTPANSADDFNPPAVLGTDAVHNTGDTNKDGRLDPGETWQFKKTLAAIGCQYTNIGTATANNANNGQPISPATDPDNYFGDLPLADQNYYPRTTSEPRTSIAFSESEVLRAYSSDLSDGTFKIWYNDEHALALGVRQVAIKATSTITKNSNVVSVVTAGLTVGASVTGNGIPAGTTIAGIVNSTSLTLSKSATAGGNVALTFTTSSTVTPMSGNPTSALNPMVGVVSGDTDPAGKDVSLRPLFPSLFVTDISLDVNNHSGDWQYHGIPIPPSAVFGTWKAFTQLIDRTHSPAVVSLTADNDPAKNNWNLGAGSDPAPAGLANEGYGAEIRWDIASLGLTPGHDYRFYVIDHDGDQNKAGGDSGQAAVNLCFHDDEAALSLAAQTSAATSTSLATASSATAPVAFFSARGSASALSIVSAITRLTDRDEDTLIG